MQVETSMSVRTIASLTIIFLSTWLAATAHSTKETNMITARSQIAPQSRTHAKTTITVQDSESKPYDQDGRSALMEVHLSETFSGDIEANRRFAPCKCCAMINPRTSSACSDSAESWAGAKAPSCFKVPKSSRAARSRRHGLSFLDPGQVILRVCAARAALKETSGKGPTDGWITGSSDTRGTAASVIEESVCLT
jgi:hypothetical protein